MILIDTNVLVYSIDISSPYHKKALDFITQNHKDICISNQNINEFLRVVTHKTFAQPLNIDEALKNVAIFTYKFNLILPNMATQQLFYQLVKEYKVTDNAIYDCYLIAIALSNNVKQVVTFNDKDFEIYKNSGINTTSL